MKNLAGLECKIGEETISMMCGSNCPLTHIKEALFQFLKYIGQLEDQAKQAQEKEQEKMVCENSENKCEQPVEE